MHKKRKSFYYTPIFRYLKELFSEISPSYTCEVFHQCLTLILMMSSLSTLHQQIVKLYHLNFIFIEKFVKSLIGNAPFIFVHF